MRTYAIGDIHGHLDHLVSAHALIAADRRAQGDAEAPVVHIGDLVDRGPNSRGVIDHLIAGLARSEPWVVLKGNHDRMFAGFLEDGQYHDPRLWSELHWMHERLGGADTLASYGIRTPARRARDKVHAEARKAVPEAHLAFLNTLPLYHLAGEVLFVHAGIRPGVDLRHQVEDDLLWIRDDFLNDSRDHGALVIHGHTSIEVAAHYGNRVNIDTGAGYGGPLATVVIEDRQVWQLTPKGRVMLAPAG